MTKKTDKPPSKSPPKAISIAKLIEEASKKFQERLDEGDYDVKLASNIAWLTRIDVQNQNDRNKRLDAISAEEMLPWAKRLSDVEWARFVHDVERVRKGSGSVLG